MILLQVELRLGWPPIRVSRIRGGPPVLAAAPPTTDNPPHRSWVVTDEGLGWIHHHEADGYVIQLVTNEVKKFAHGSWRHAKDNEAPR